MNYYDFTFCIPRTIVSHIVFDGRWRKKFFSFSELCFVVCFCLIYILCVVDKRLKWGRNFASNSRMELHRWQMVVRCILDQYMDLKEMDDKGMSFGDDYDIAAESTIK